MRLTDLNPQWCSHGGEGVTRSSDGAPIPLRERIGIGLDCPCGCGHRLTVLFANPVDGQGPIDARTTWTRAGETFEDLTLTPSILRKVPCTWHGWITNGEVITC